MLDTLAVQLRRHTSIQVLDTLAVPLSSHTSIQVLDTLAVQLRRHTSVLYYVGYISRSIKKAHKCFILCWIH